MRMNPEDVQNVLAAALPDCQVEVTGGAGKFHVRARGESFTGLGPVKQQQVIYQHLNEYISRGDIHAVTMDLGA